MVFRGQALLYSMPLSNTGCLKKKYSGLIDHNFRTNEAYITRITALDRRKTDLHFDMLQLYIAKKFTKILMLKLSCIFLDMCKINENRHIKFYSLISQLKGIIGKLVF